MPFRHPHPHHLKGQAHREQLPIQTTSMAVAATRNVRTEEARSFSGTGFPRWKCRHKIRNTCCTKHCSLIRCVRQQRQRNRLLKMMHTNQKVRFGTGQRGERRRSVGVRCLLFMPIPAVRIASPKTTIHTHALVKPGSDRNRYPVDLSPPLPKCHHYVTVFGTAKFLLSSPQALTNPPLQNGDIFVSGVPTPSKIEQNRTISIFLQNGPRCTNDLRTRPRHVVRFCTLHLRSPG
jgi:hypothetical protein